MPTNPTLQKITALWNTLLAQHDLKDFPRLRAELQQTYIISLRSTNPSFTLLIRDINHKITTLTLKKQDESIQTIIETLQRTRAILSTPEAENKSPKAMDYKIILEILKLPVAFHSDDFQPLQAIATILSRLDQIEENILLAARIRYETKYRQPKKANEVAGMRFIPFWVVTGMLAIGVLCIVAVMTFRDTVHYQTLLNTFVNTCKLFEGFDSTLPSLEKHKMSSSRYNLLRDCCNDDPYCYSEVSSVAEALKQLEKAIGGFLVPICITSLIFLMGYMNAIPMNRIYLKKPAAVLDDIHTKLTQINLHLRITPVPQEVLPTDGDETVLRHVRAIQDYLYQEINRTEPHASAKYTEQSRAR